MVRYCLFPGPQGNVLVSIVHALVTYTVEISKVQLVFLPSALNCVESLEHSLETNNRQRGALEVYIGIAWSLVVG